MLRSLGKKRATVLYPVEKVDVPEDFRGRLEIRDDLCIGCAKCALMCPSEAIAMVGEKGEKKVLFHDKEMHRKKHPEVNLLSCIRCNVCAEGCPTKAIYLTTRFSGASGENVILVVPTLPKDGGSDV